METTQLKKFAAEARLLLRQGVVNKIATLGFDARGEVREDLVPILAQEATNFGGRIIEGEAFYHQWMALREAVQSRGLRQVYEEAAYTWFNRFVAIRILQKNDIVEPVLDFADEARTPQLVKNAQMGILPPGMGERTQRRLAVLLNDTSRTTEQFALLITAFCHATPLIDRIFGRIDDYTELLLPDNILAPDGFLDRLNHTPYITDDDYRHTELIGWLYQFYISDRKDEVFASFQKGRKAEAEDIPAATQIFTPNWIVKYMVENTLGRIYLDNNPDAPFKDEMRYLVDECPVPEGEVKPVLHIDSPLQLKCADLSCGSGHILTEMFDLLMKIYDAEWYDTHDAIENIFSHNLTGIDIDTRAKQLSVFALMLKACQLDKSFADAHILPRVYDMPRVPDYSDLDEYLPHFFLGGSKKIIKETKDALELMKQASNLGSIMKFELSEETRDAIQEAVARWKEPPLAKAHQAILPCFDLMLALTEKYAAVVMNPPYMGSGNMNATLSQYVKDNYPEGKADLCTTFMLMQADRTVERGYYANIVPPSWMFLSTFEGLRRSIIDNQTIQSLLHLSRGVFGADFGSVSTVIQNCETNNGHGTYFRLIERTFQEFDQNHLRMLFEKTLENHDFRFFFADYIKDVTDIVYSENGAKIYYPNVEQKNFEKIPGLPIAYWISNNILSCFTCNKTLGDIQKAYVGLMIGDNKRFLRNWQEVSLKKIGFNLSSNEESKKSKLKWFPINKGGEVRKWYGNHNEVINWENDGYEIKNFRDDNGKLLSRPQNLMCNFKSTISWNMISSNGLSFRFFPNGFVLNTASCSYPCQDIYGVLGLLNSKFINEISNIINPTINTTNGVIEKFPYMVIDDDSYRNIVKNSIEISKSDWNSHETSWDFEQSPLLAIQQEMKEQGEAGENLLRNLVDKFIEKWEGNFMQLHANEEELNRQFIEIYGLQDELTPDVSLDEITILQQGEITIE